MAAVPAADVERMEFQLALRRRGISDQAVLRAMDEVPREYFVAAGLRRERLCRPGAADRLRPDHQPALCRRLYDRAARCRAAASGARDRHRLRLSGRDPVAARARGGQHRALPHAGRCRARSAQDARLRQCHHPRRRRHRRARRIWRRSTASWSPPPPRKSRSACRRSLPKAARWSCRSARATARNTSSSSTKTAGRRIQPREPHCRCASCRFCPAKRANCSRCMKHTVTNYLKQNRARHLKPCLPQRCLVTRPVCCVRVSNHVRIASVGHLAATGCHFVNRLRSCEL